MEKGLTRSQIFAELIRSPHGNLEDYLKVGVDAAKQDPEFFAHLIAWNGKKGEVRDAQAALPILALATTKIPDFRENAYAALASLDLRTLIKAIMWTEGKLEAREKKTTARVFGQKQAKPAARMQAKPPALTSKRELRRFVERYLKNLEANRAEWDRVALQHRQALHYLYRKFRVAPSKRALGVLFGPSAKRPTNPGLPQGSIFEKIPLLKSMSLDEAAGTIIAGKVPFLVARGALGARAKEPATLQALIDRMSPAELINSTKLLEKWGLKDNPALRAAYEKALQKASESKKATATLKAGKAAEAVSDEKLKTKLTALQEKKLDTKSIQGNWLVLADKSGSMEPAIEVARHVAAVLARLADKVYLVFFDYGPTRYDVTGKSLEEIQKLTKNVLAQGGTSIGTGVAYAIANNWEVDGIAVVSDGGENTHPYFHTEYPKLCAKLGKDVPVYYYSVRPQAAGARVRTQIGRTIFLEGDTFEGSMELAKIPMDKFPIDPTSIDYYSIPNLVQSMRTNRYSMTDEIMDTPLRSLDDVFKNTHKQEGELVNAE